MSTGPNDPNARTPEQRQAEIRSFQQGANGAAQSPPMGMGYPQRPSWMGGVIGGSQMSPYGYSPPASMWDALVQGIKYLTNYRLAELILAVLIIGYFAWYEPKRSAELREERAAASAETSRTMENIAREHKEATREVSETFKGGLLQMREDTNRQLQLMFSRERTDREEDRKKFGGVTPN